MIRSLLAIAASLGALPIAGCSEPVGAGAAEPPPVSAASASQAAPAAARTPSLRPDRISALGRLQPEDGVIQVAGPSGGPVVIWQLLVDDGDPVKAGQLLARLDTVPVLQANVKRLEAEHGNAKRDLERNLQLHREDAVSDSQRDGWETRVRVTRAELAMARAELERALVHSPVDGRVLRVHAREGEQVGDEGILELGRTDDMFAIAEVYETDIGRVRVGQRARITSPALPAPLEGTVDWIHLQVAKADAIGTDPAARQDARVVEVEIRLDDSQPAAGLTNLQVEVEIEP